MSCQSILLLLFLTTMTLTIGLAYIQQDHAASALPAAANLNAHSNSFQSGLLSVVTSTSLDFTTTQTEYQLRRKLSSLGTASGSGSEALPHVCPPPPTCPQCPPLPAPIICPPPVACPQPPPPIICPAVVPTICPTCPPVVNITCPAPPVCVLDLAAQEAAAVERLQLVHHLSQPFYCRMDSFIHGNWSEDGHIFIPHTLSTLEGVDTRLRPQIDQYRIYDATEVRDCLRGRRLYFIGPSYMRDVYTTLVDLLHNYRRRGYHQMNPPLKNETLLGTGFRDIEFVNANGFLRDFQKIQASMQKFAGEILFADELIWDINEPTIRILLNDTQMTSEIYFMNVRRFLDLCKEHNVKLIWMTQMSQENARGLSTVPTRYRDQQTDDNFMFHIKRTITMLQEYDYPWLDVFHMTRECITEPTETDPEQVCNPSAHSNWYVSTMKVQMVLNWFCRGCQHPYEWKKQIGGQHQPIAARRRQPPTQIIMKSGRR